MNDARDPEPPLHGKQLVFVFMAATVAAVVVFLAGVMVGRGVRLQRGGFIAGESLSDPTLDPAPPLAAPTGSSSTGPSPASREGLTYPTQLSELNPPDVMAEPADDPTAEVTGRGRSKATKPVADDVKAEPARPEKPADKSAEKSAQTGAEKPTDKPAQTGTAKPADKAPEKGADKNAEKGAGKTSEKPGEKAAPGKPEKKDAAAKDGAAKPVDAPPDAESAKGYAVQVAAVRDRAEADRIATRLKAKGYQTYITSPAPGMFRVRVGKFPDLEKANAAAARLEKEEQFKPWITK